MSISKIKLLKELYENNVFIFEEKTLKSGQKSPYYCNFRILLSRPELFSKLVDYIEMVISKYEINYDLLCGIMTGGLSYSNALSYKLKKKQIVCRTDKKEYGMKNLIDGVFNVGDKVLLIEDVLTTGESVMEVVKKLRLRGLEVNDVIVLFDRNQEGELILENSKLNVYSLFSLNELINFIESNQLQEQMVIEKLKFYYDKNLKLKHTLLEDHKNKDLSRKELIQRDLNLLFDNEFNRKLIDIIKQKQSALCVSLDIPFWKEGVKILRKIAPYICMIKLHCDLIVDWSKETITELKEIAKESNFLIMQDSKFIDVPHIVEKQLSLSNYNICNWADCVTVHWENYKDLKKLENTFKLKFINVVEMNTLEHNFSDDYYKSVNQLIDPYFAKDKVHGYRNESDCIVSQSRYKKNGNVLKLTPGVVENEEDLGLVNSDRYRTIENAMVRDRNHIVIIGSNIIYDDNVLEKCERCAKLTWYYFNLNYKKIIDFKTPTPTQKAQETPTPTSVENNQSQNDNESIISLN